MKKFILFILLGGLTSPLIGQTIEKRTIGDYDAIYISGWFDVDLVPGEEGTIELNGKEKYLKYISTEVNNGKLTVKWDKRYNATPFYSWSKIQITIPVEDIEEVALSGSGSIIGKTTLKASKFATYLSGSGKIDLAVEATDLKSVLSGSGDAILNGTAKDFVAEVSGSGDIEAFDLEADKVTAIISGSADVKVHANESITARISGSGDVRYIGRARKINSKVSGSGSVSKENSL
ncbi:MULTISPECIES: head GIN domain-containing protein [Flavobacteriaceae]|uniref:head GIN domain-containing protein n=1 Tax=Flavobacteriaceae TaxID=49546 RepID=UPI001490AD3B|nr:MULTISPECIES: head GIN domain-containing protein [Allomuricauda]MDC6367027.1 DUF2807 domain-containing protein [Muricauda sp. AC10]